jgi:hypothetical protein
MFANRPDVDVFIETGHLTPIYIFVTSAATGGFLVIDGHKRSGESLREKSTLILSTPLASGSQVLSAQICD